jgi:hypothetical protein
MQQARTHKSWDDQESRMHEISKDHSDEHQSSGYSPHLTLKRQVGLSLDNRLSLVDPLRDTAGQDCAIRDPMAGENLVSLLGSILCAAHDDERALLRELFDFLDP